MASSSSFALDFLRRLLCAHATGNSDGTAVASRRDAPGHLAAPEPEGEGRSPCIVARLMGMDAMPAAEAPPAPPLRRSRSEGRSLSPCGHSDANAAAAPAKVRASASLREKPAYLRAENDMFLLLSFSPEDRGAETAVLLAGEDKAERCDSGANNKQRRGRRRKLRFGDGDDDEAESSASASGRRDCSAQGSSPVSVLEARDAHEESSTTTTTTTSSSLEDVEPCSATSGEARFALEQQISREKSQTDLDQLDEVTPARSSVHASRCSDRERRHRRMVNECEVSTSYVSGIWPPVCRVVEEDIRNMEWLPRDGANVVAEMDSDILDQLIYEATVELVQLTSDLHALPLHSPLLRKCSGKPSNWRYPSPRQIQERQAVGGY
ncbi:hypothetical protein EJB05_34152, partial [Eragrostis curvula]